jgi:hypothetical protein
MTIFLFVPRFFIVCFEKGASPSTGEWLERTHTHWRALSLPSPSYSTLTVGWLFPPKASSRTGCTLEPSGGTFRVEVGHSDRPIAEVIKISKSSIVWDIMFCSPLKLKVNQRFRATCRLHLQCRKISWARNQCDRRCDKQSRLVSLFYAGFLLGLFFDHKDGGDMFFRNVCWLSTDYMALYLGR